MLDNRVLVRDALATVERHMEKTIRDIARSESSAGIRPLAQRLQELDTVRSFLLDHGVTGRGI